MRIQLAGRAEGVGIQLEVGEATETWLADRGYDRSPYQPGNVDQLAAVPGATSVWAIGNVYGPGDGTTLNRGAIWRYDR